MDLLVERHGTLRLAIEIKCKQRVAGADTSGLRSFHEAHPKVPTCIVSLAPEPYELGGGVRVLPYAQFLTEFERLL